MRAWHRPKPAMLLLLCGAATFLAATAAAQSARAPVPPKLASRPKLVVLLVVDQMRGDYVDKFRGQWTGGLKRLVEEGAWFRDAAYPYAATETCVGHSTISTGRVPGNPRNDCQRLVGPRNAEDGDLHGRP